MAEDKTSENPQQTGKNDKNDRIYKLAMCIVIFGLSFVTLMGVASITAAIVGLEAQGFDEIKDILNILLPVISAWIGTILAFYFSEKNYSAATKNTKELYTQFRTTEEKLKSITAKEVMIDIDEAVKLVMKKDQKEEEIKLIEHIIDGRLEPSGRNRLPILDHQIRPKYVIHRSVIDKFIAKSARTQTTPAKKPEELHLQDMLNDPLFENILKNSFRTVKETSNLAEVKSYIDKVEGCSDVFVTEDGGKTSKVLGWITNVIVTKKCVA